MKTTNYWKLHFKHSMTGMHISNRVYIEILRNTRPRDYDIAEGQRRCVMKTTNYWVWRPALQAHAFVIFSDICRVNRLCEGKIVRPILVSDTRKERGSVDYGAKNGFRILRFDILLKAAKFMHPIATVRKESIDHHRIKFMELGLYIQRNHNTYTRPS
ncbi:hypothetical protein JHK82_026834 [Glycine max]|nr:hypothetical protein JHK85_027458 [Glycine max]KAG5002818.1 hypothetical protein JHK86_026957 [Glycine max]KAG5125999.1 hypothetical protein JHK82_026834 [Glycine max]